MAVALRRDSSEAGPSATMTPFGGKRRRPEVTHARRGSEGGHVSCWAIIGPRRPPPLAAYHLDSPKLRHRRACLMPTHLSAGSHLNPCTLSPTDGTSRTKRPQPPIGILASLRYFCMISCRSITVLCNKFVVQLHEDLLLWDKLHEDLWLRIWGTVDLIQFSYTAIIHIPMLHGITNSASGSSVVS
jgi:hypothetical protein